MQQHARAPVNNETDGPVIEVRRNDGREVLQHLDEHVAGHLDIVFLW